MRILAIEDGGFRITESKNKGKALLVGVVTYDFYIEKLVVSHIQIDGLDATSSLIGLAKKAMKPLDLIILKSVSLAGFNLADIEEVYSKLKIPLIIVNPKKPVDDALEKAIKSHFQDWKERLQIIHKMKKPMKLRLKGSYSAYIQVAGISIIKAKKIIKELIIFGKRPEPLRIARILAYELGK